MADDKLSATFAALADPTRRAVLARLAKGEASVSELAKPFAISLPGFSKHLKVLERAGLIARRADAQFRRCRLKPQRLREVAAWVADYRAFWDDAFDRLEGHLKDAKRKENSRGRKKQ